MSALHFSVVPRNVILEVALALLEGARKYGRHNWRKAGVRASVYLDATERHLAAWWEGQDVDPDSGLSHLTKAIASLTVLRDAMAQGMMTDDRPPPSPETWLSALYADAERIIDAHPDPKPAVCATDLDPDPGLAPTFVPDNAFLFRIVPVYSELDAAAESDMS